MVVNKIKSFSLLVLCFTFFVLSVCGYAAPFLTCDPQTGVTHYEVTVAGKTEIVQAGANTGLWYDLSAFGPGDYHFQVKAMIINSHTWGVSDASPFDGTCVPLVPVSGLSVVNK